MGNEDAKVFGSNRMKNRIAKIALMVSVLAFGVWYTGLMPPQTAKAAPGDLTVVVTRVFPTRDTVGLVLELRNDGVVVFTKIYNQQFDPAIGLTVGIRDKIQKRMQKDIDIYKAKYVVYMSAGYVNAPAIVESNLVLN